MKKAYCLAFLFCCLSMMLACGGGGGGGGSTGGGITPPPPPPPPQPAVTITTTTLPAGVAGVSYSTSLSASGGTAPYTWDFAVPTPWFTLSADGVLSGTYPTAFGGDLFSVQVRVKDSSATPLVAIKSLTLDMFGYYTSFRLPQVGVYYGQEGFVQAHGGIEPIHWQLSGTIPTGLSFITTDSTSRDYCICGKPTTAGKYTFTITATDSGSPARTFENTYTLDVEPAVLKLPNSLLPVAVVGQPYSYSFAPNGGAAPFQWTFERNDGTLPSGITFDASTGLLHGTPSEPGYVGFGITVTDTSAPQVQTTKVYNWLLVSPTPLSPHNDSISTAVTVFPGHYEASISPYRDASGNVAPDQDYYKMSSAPGNILRVGAVGERRQIGSRPSTIDPVVEILDANGHRYNTCNDPLDDDPPAGASIPKDTTPTGFDDPCMNWEGVVAPSYPFYKGSSLTFKVPDGAADQVFYIHVFDWRGDARPDMFYSLDIIPQ